MRKVVMMGEMKRAVERSESTDTHQETVQSYDGYAALRSRS